MPRSIRKHLILATLATVLSLAGCDSTSSSSSSALVNFSTTPTGWMKTTDYKMSSTITADVFLTSVSVTGYPPNAAIVTSPTSGISVDSAAKLELQTMQLESSNFSLDSSKSIKVHGAIGMAAPVPGYGGRVFPPDAGDPLRLQVERLPDTFHTPPKRQHKRKRHHAAHPRKQDRPQLGRCMGASRPRRAGRAACRAPPSIVLSVGARHLW